MNASLANPSHPTFLDELARSLVGHLQEEAAALHDATISLETMHQALRGANLDGVRSARSQQEGLAARLEGLRRVRADLIESASRALRTTPEALNLRTLASRLPGILAQELEEARQRTHHLALRVDSLNRQNAVLALHCLAFVQDCLGDLYGEAAAARYSSAGRPVETPRGSLLEVQG